MRLPFSLCACVSHLIFFVFYAVHATSKESRRLVFPCFIIYFIIIIFSVVFKEDWKF
jgi:hypothetical protein